MHTNYVVDISIYDEFDRVVQHKTQRIETLNTQPSQGMVNQIEKSMTREQRCIYNNIPKQIAVVTNIFITDVDHQYVSGN